VEEDDRVCEFRRAKKVRSRVSRLEVRVLRRRRVGECESELGQILLF
jgi:hypothetical protein